MYEYDEECLKTFILNQGQLFDEPVAETLEEAEAFLEDCMASIVDSIEEVKEFLRVKIRTRTKGSKRKSRDYFVVSAFFSAFSMA